MSKPNKQPACQSPVPCREGLRRSCPAIVVVVLCVSFPGCGKDGDAEADATRKIVENLSHELRTEYLRRDREFGRYAAELAVAKGDREAAVFGWVSTAAAVIVLVLLLVRERRARRILERLLRVVLDRIRESHSPPPSHDQQE